MGWFNKTPPPPPPKTVIAGGTRINGTLSTRSEIELEGTVTGAVKTDAVLRVLPGGTLEGEADCRRIDCRGTLKGSVRTSEMLTFRETATWRGELSTPKLSIEKGARLEGRLQERSE
jgi:cytoskeletal protein CcmA (bactofilin family)